MNEETKTNATAKGAKTSEGKLAFGAMAIALIGALLPFLQQIVSNMPNGSPYAMAGGAVCAIAAALVSNGYSNARATIKSAQITQEASPISELALSAAQEAIPAKYADAVALGLQVLAAKKATKEAPLERTFRVDELPTGDSEPDEGDAPRSEVEL